jgi:hypothetical protein
MYQYNNTPTIACVIEPASEPLTLAETKTYLKITNSGDDALITSLITTVRKAAENFLRSSLITQSWKLSYDKYAPSYVPLPMGPVQSVTSVIAIARDTTISNVSASSYYLSSGNRRIIFDASPIGKRIEIVYVAGYGDSGANIPSPLKYGMLGHLAAVYDGRAGGQNLPKQSLDFYLPYRGIEI